MPNTTCNVAADFSNGFEQPEVNDTNKDKKSEQEAVTVPLLLWAALEDTIAAIVKETRLPYE
jgi:hypothetical protein